MDNDIETLATALYVKIDDMLADWPGLAPDHPADGMAPTLSDAGLPAVLGDHRPIVSIALSVWLFEESFTSDAAVLAMGAVGFAVMCAGVVVLTQTTPATMKADTHTDNEGDGQQARQAPVTGVQGADHDPPPGRAAPDRRRPASGRLPPGRDERDRHGP